MIPSAFLGLKPSRDNQGPIDSPSVRHDGDIGKSTERSTSDFGYPLDFEEQELTHFAAVPPKISANSWVGSGEGRLKRGLRVRGDRVMPSLSLGRSLALLVLSL